MTDLKVVRSEPVLDGTERIVPTPFDHHEQAVRQPHTHSKKDGYVAADMQSTDEYPKVVGYTGGEDDDKREPIIVKNAEEEEKYKASLAPEPEVTEADQATLPAPELEDGNVTE